MPNHIHLLLEIEADENGRALHAPTIQRIITHFKGCVTKNIRKKIWQKSFHDHIVRNPQKYDMIAKYIVDNPRQWKYDCFFLP